MEPGRRVAGTRQHDIRRVMIGQQPWRGGGHSKEGMGIEQWVVPECE